MSKNGNPINRYNLNQCLNTAENEKNNRKIALKEAENEAVLRLEKAMDSLTALSKMRLENKLSNSRVAGVAREVNELIKVMSIYL